MTASLRGTRRTPRRRHLTQLQLIVFDDAEFVLSAQRAQDRQVLKALDTHLSRKTAC